MSPASVSGHQKLPTGGQRILRHGERSPWWLRGPPASRSLRNRRQGTRAHAPFWARCHHVDQRISGRVLCVLHCLASVSDVVSAAERRAGFADEPDRHTSLSQSTTAKSTMMTLPSNALCADRCETDADRPQPYCQRERGASSARRKMRSRSSSTSAARTATRRDHAGSSTSESPSAIRASISSATIWTISSTFASLSGSSRMSCRSCDTPVSRTQPARGNCRSAPLAVDVSRIVRPSSHSRSRRRHARPRRDARCGSHTAAQVRSGVEGARPCRRR